MTHNHSLPEEPPESSDTSQGEPPFEPQRSWPRKFANAFRGVALGVRGQTSFPVHGLAAAAVCIAAVLLGVGPTQWCVLLLCMALVITAELLNSAIEHLARAVTSDHNPHIGAALDIASGAVLVASIFAGLIGALTLLPELLPEMLP